MLMIFVILRLLKNLAKTTQVLGGAGCRRKFNNVQTTLIGLCGDDGRSIDVKKMCSDIGIMPQLIIDESK